MIAKLAYVKWCVGSLTVCLPTGWRWFLGTFQRNNMARHFLTTRKAVACLVLHPQTSAVTHSSLIFRSNLGVLKSGYFKKPCVKGRMKICLSTACRFETRTTKHHQTSKATETKALTKSYSNKHKETAKTRKQSEMHPLLVFHLSKHPGVGSFSPLPAGLSDLLLRFWALSS